MANYAKAIEDYAAGPIEASPDNPWIAGMNAPKIDPVNPNQFSPWNYSPGNPEVSHPFGFPVPSLLGKAKDAWRVFSTIGKNIPVWNRIGGIGRLLATGAAAASAVSGVKSVIDNSGGNASPVTKDSTLDYSQTLKNSYSFPSILRSSTNINAPMPTNVNFLGKNYNLSYDSKNNIFTFDTEYGKMYVNPDTGIGSFTSPIVG